MQTASTTRSPVNHRGGQSAYLLLAKGQFGAEHLAVTWVDCPAGSEQPLHMHAGLEQVYVIVRGSARVKVEDEIVELGEWDAIRFDKDTMRNVEAGPEGVEYLAFGAGTDPRDAEMSPGWWSE